MSNLPISSKYRSNPGGAVDNQEREALVARVNDAFTQGAIDDFAYREMLDQVFAAHNLGQLAPVVERLPAQATHQQPAIVAQSPSGKPGELAPAQAPSNKLVLGVVGVTAIAIVLLILLILL